MQRITLENKPRERAYKVRKTSVFSQADDLLLFVLSYMKLNPLQEAHGATFGLSQYKVCVWLSHCFPVLEEALASEKVLPARTNQELKKRIKDCKADNREKSSERVVVEHSIGGMKTWRCVREISRPTSYDRRDSLTWYAAGLHNFRL